MQHHCCRAGTLQSVPDTGGEAGSEYRHSQCSSIACVRSQKSRAGMFRWFSRSGLLVAQRHVRREAEGGDAQLGLAHSTEETRILAIHIRTTSRPLVIVVDRTHIRIHRRHAHSKPHTYSRTSLVPTYRHAALYLSLSLVLSFSFEGTPQGLVAMFAH